MSGELQTEISLQPISRVAAKGVDPSRAALPKGPCIYFVGDSHVSALAQLTEMVDEYPAIVKSIHRDVWVCRLGAVLAGTMHRSDTSQGGRNKAFSVLQQIEAGSTVFLLMGEIDCRIHVIKRSGFDTAAIPQTVNATMRNYLAFVTEFTSLAAKRDIRVGLISPPPSYRIPHAGFPGWLAAKMINPKWRGAKQVAAKILRNLFHKKSQVRAALMVSYSYLGTTEMRNMAARLMRDEMANYCSDSGLMFVDMFSPFIGEDDASSMRWYWDDIHLHGNSIAELAPQFSQFEIHSFNSECFAADRFSSGSK